jgi:hypothetical protein|tara:strand:+ start:85 stop:390 length:306 start_codon:yes stop_codon:yes gene_type:complete
LEGFAFHGLIGLGQNICYILICVDSNSGGLMILNQIPYIYGSLENLFRKRGSWNRESVISVLIAFGQFFGNRRETFFLGKNLSQPIVGEWDLQRLSSYYLS